MAKQTYNWKRFWCPRNARINLGDRGYLFDPESEWGRHVNPELVGLEAIADVPCLVLLGEPGIGKSQEMKNLESYTRKLIEWEREYIGEDDQILSLDLEGCNEEKLYAKLFKSQVFLDWIKKGKHRLYLFLDSLDQGWLNVSRLPSLLIDELRSLDEFSEKSGIKFNQMYLLLALKTGFLQEKLKIEKRPNLSRLYLRIACRTAVFSPVETNFKELWGNSAGIYDLEPLCLSDIKAALCELNLDADACLEEIQHLGLMPLAIKPISLEFILKKLRRNNGKLSSHKQTEIYLDGCRELCREPKDESLHPLRPLSNLEVDKRLIIAARIAAITTFCIRSTVWIEESLGDNNPDEDVLISELCGEKENTKNEGQLQINRSAIREVLDTGLFSSRGTNRMGWAHQTYAEFLAAWYLKQHNLSLSQILSLILHPDGRVIPQLQEITAWLASMIPEVFQEVVKTDPDMLLQSDISTIDDENKARLVETLLKFHDEEKLKYDWRRYSNLNYPGLAALLESYIRDSSKNPWSRLVAIDIVRDCDVKAAQDCLAKTALDPTQPYIVRTHAASTICEIGDEETKKRLKPLALGDVGNDPEDYLKGYALQAVFPQHISVHELVENITQPKSQSIGGPYSDFIAEDIAKKLPIQSLPVMLKWLERFPRRYDLHYPFRELTDSVMLKAWQSLDEPGVLEVFANIAILKLNQHDGILGDRPHRDDDVEPLVRESDEKRRQLIETIVLLISESESDFLWLTDIICSEDVLWIIERITSAKSPRIVDVWVSLLRQALIRHNLCWKNTKHIDAILEARNLSPAMQSEFEIEIELGSEKAKQAEADYLQYQNWLKPPEPEPTLDPPPKQRVLAALGKVEAEQPQLWWQIVVEMTLMPTSKQYIHNHIFESDITKLPGWEEAEADTKARIVETAKKYLDAGDPETQAWLGTNNFSHPPFAGYQALYLLVKQEPEFISKISTDTWTKWIPVILKSINFLHRNTGSKEDNVCQEIARTAYQSAPDALIERLISLMVHNNYQPRTFYPDDVYRLTNELLDQCLASLIIGRVPDNNLNAGMLEVLLTDLFNHDIDKAKEIAKSFLPAKVPESGEERDKAIVAARLFATHPDNSSWSVFWSAVQQDYEFGREVLESIAFQSARQGQIESKIREDYLADLYIFLAQQYPEIEQHELEKELRGIEAQILGDFDGVRMWWKNYIPQRIQARGTPEACDALRRMIRELPEQKDQLQPRLLEAESLARRNTWQPPKPEEILQLVLDQNKRLVRDGHQLLNVLLESLKRLELELQGETPACRDLWDRNQGESNLFRPIDENAFSDYVKRFLDRDIRSRGIVVNREVELRRSYGGNPGERTDIHVDAVLKHPNGDTYDSITVIIEVKGCWHSEVQTAMQSQLVERYLADNACPYGLYLVGWFNCQQWDSKDLRKKQVPKIALDEARIQFDEQAQRLTSSVNRVRAYVLNTALR
jgi:predicted NACHT family NTPase